MEGKPQCSGSSESRQTAVLQEGATGTRVFPISLRVSQLLTGQRKRSEAEMF